MVVSRESLPFEHKKMASIEGWKERDWVSKTITEEGQLIVVRMREGFDAVGELEKRKGVTVEIAGPTEKGFLFHILKGDAVQRVDLFEKRKVFVSNLYPGAPEFERTTGQFKHFSGIVNFLADAKELPLRGKAAEVIFCSCLGGMGLRGVSEMIRAGVEHKVPTSEKHRFVSGEGASRTSNVALRKKAIAEAWRVLAPNGLLIWKGGFREDLQSIAETGFTIVQNEFKPKGGSNYEGIYDLILLKDVNLKLKSKHFL